MNWFDLVVAVLVILTLVRGFFSGFIMQVATLAGIVLGAVFAGKVAEYITPGLLEITKAPPHIIGPLSYAFAFIIILIALSFAGKLLESFANALKMNTLNKIGGALFCTAKWIVVFSILLSLLVGFDQDKKIIKEDIREQSYTYPLVMKVAQAAIPYLRFDWF